MIPLMYRHTVACAQPLARSNLQWQWRAVRENVELQTGWQQLHVAINNGVGGVDGGGSDCGGGGGGGLHWIASDRPSDWPRCEP